MRNVEIVKEPGAQRCWVAVDFASRERVLQVHDRALLEGLCWRLGWMVVANKDMPERSNRLASRNDSFTPES